ncbi:DUF5342 family protein [Tuberibacillus sp. Marseille-P3662]|uniref:DUF5342 family protein n=1 Tax=Tuberibacillus sp. Marseille-P3662 TaxID=1965358 RepID=UPI000A1CD9C4|nr:DUF5342 family protein [Tuberibacillus sp. Marseille-P3662]
MLTHFTYQPFFSSENRRREYQISFFYHGKPYRAIYHYNGEVDWQTATPPDSEIEPIMSQLHELMLFHVYDT